MSDEVELWELPEEDYCATLKQQGDLWVLDIPGFQQICIGRSRAEAIGRYLMKQGQVRRYVKREMVGKPMTLEEALMIKIPVETPLFNMIPRQPSPNTLQLQVWKALEAFAETGEGTR